MKKLLIIFGSLISMNVLAVGHVIDTKIESVYCGYPNSHQMCSITFSKPIIDKDSCHTSSERMQFKVDTDIGKALLSIALSAHAAQKNADVYSTGSCTVFDGLADVNWITIRN